MSVADIAVGALLVSGCAAALLSVAGVLFARDDYEAIHYQGPASTLGIAAVAAAILVRESVNPAGIKAILIFLVTVASGAVVSHAMARAVRRRASGVTEVLPGDDSGGGDTP